MDEPICWTLWIDVDLTRQEITNPSWSQIESAISQMNNASRGYVYLQHGTADDEETLPYMEAFGGIHNRYLVLYTDANTVELTAVLHDLTQTHPIEISMSYLNERNTLVTEAVPRELALNAFAYFFEHEKRSPDLQWSNMGGEML